VVASHNTQDLTKGIYDMLPKVTTQTRLKASWFFIYILLWIMFFLFWWFWLTFYSTPHTFMEGNSSSSIHETWFSNIYIYIYILNAQANKENRKCTYLIPSRCMHVMWWIYGVKDKKRIEATTAFSIIKKHKSKLERNGQNSIT